MIFLTKLITNNIIQLKKLEAKIAFKDLQKACIAKLVLKIFKIKNSICIKTNTLNLVIKIYFSQKYKSKQHLVVY